MREDYKPKYIERKHTGQYLHYTSNQPEHVKIGIIKKLVRRAKIVCSTEESLTDELDYIKKTMWLNGYPEKLITKTIKHCHLIVDQRTTKTWKRQNFLYHMKKEY